MVHPVLNAISAVRNKTEELTFLALKVKQSESSNGDMTAVNQLSMSLQGVLIIYQLVSKVFKKFSICL